MLCSKFTSVEVTARNHLTLPFAVTTNDVICKGYLLCGFDLHYPWQDYEYNEDQADVKKNQVDWLRKAVK